MEVKRQAIGPLMNTDEHSFSGVVFSETREVPSRNLFSESVFIGVDLWLLAGSSGLGGDAGAHHAVADVGLGGFSGDFAPLP